MAKEDVKFEVELDKRAKDFFMRFPARMDKVKDQVVEAAGKIWADETKEITTQEDHIDTGLYVNSIGYSTGSPSDPKWDLSENENGTKLTVGVGSSVDYAEVLEKRYNLMARGLDRSKGRIESQIGHVIKRNLDL